MREWEWNTLDRTTSVLSPTPRDSMDAAYDSAREVCVMFGGYDGSIRLADTWEYTLLDSSGYLPILLVMRITTRRRTTTFYLQVSVTSAPNFLATRHGNNDNS